MNNNKIAAGQFFLFMFVIRITSFFLFPVFLSSGNSIWEDIIPFLFLSMLSFFLMLPLTIFHNQSTSNYPDFQDTKILLILKIIVFSIVMISKLLLLESFISAFGNNQLNILLLVLFFFAASVYAARGGIEAIVRFSAFVFAMLIITCAIVFLTAFPSFSTDNIPKFTASDNLLSMNKMMSVTSLFTDYAIIFSVSRNIKGSFYRCMGIWNVFSFLLCGCFLILLGGSMNYYLHDLPFPYFHIIDITGELQRFDPVFIGIALSGLFCTSGICLYIVFDSVRLLSGNRQPFHIISPEVIVTLILVLFLISRSFSPFTDFFRSNVLSTVILILFAIIIPVICIYRTRNNHFSFAKITKISALVLSVSIVSLVFSGCMPIQLNQRIIVQGIGLDRSEDQYTATMLILDTDEKDKDNAVKIMSYSGKSVAGLLQEFENQKGKKLLFSQCLFIILNSEAAKYTDDSLSDLAQRDDIIKTTDLMVCRDNTADLLQTAVKDWGYHPEDINMLSDSKASEQNTIHFSLYDYLSVRNNPYNDIVLPLVASDKSSDCLVSEEGFLIAMNSHKCIELNNDEMLGALLLNGKIAYLQSESKKIHSVYYPDYLSVEIVPERIYNNVAFSFYIHLKLNSPSQEMIQYINSEYTPKTMNAINKILSENGCDIFKLYQTYSKLFPDNSISPDLWHEILKQGNYHVYFDITK